MNNDKIKKNEFDDEYFKKNLSSDEYKVLRQKGTEPAFSGKLLHNSKKGIYTCGGCNEELFSSDKKYDSKSGWPSFYDAIDNKKIKLEKDSTLFMHRIEVRCAKCNSHLGHLFDDGPKPTGKRYCINSLSLKFKEKNE